MAQKVEIDINQPLNPGDIVELHFKTIGMTWIQAAQIAAIEWFFKISKKPFEILSWEITPEKTSVIFTFKVLRSNPVIITVAVIAAAICAVGVVAWLTLDKAYQIIESPGSTVAFGSLGLIGIAVIAGLIINALSKK
jgi:fucose 4-O-acetylase-like acetyltransferase